MDSAVCGLKAPFAILNTGDDVDIQIKDIGYILAGGDIAKGDEVTASSGLAVKAEAGNYVVGIALSAVTNDEYCRVQIAKYQKA